MEPNTPPQPPADQGDGNKPTSNGIITPSVQTPEPPAKPSIYPAPTSGFAAATPTHQNPATANTKPSKSGGMYGRLSLIFGLLGVATAVLLILEPGLISSLSMAYVWFAGIFAAGIIGFIMGLKALKGQAVIDRSALVGLIVSIIVGLNCLIIGTYYIKFTSALRQFETQFNTSDSFEFNTSDSFEFDTWEL